MKLIVFTGTRAEYGLLRPLIKLLAEDEEVELRILASGSHLSANYGETITEIIKDDFAPLDKIDTDVTDNSVSAVAASAGRGIELYGSYFSSQKPDLLLLLGDRYEAFAAAAAATINCVPIAHIHGGEITEGAIDNVFRHAITKMAHLHFTACEKYRSRVIQMGEEPHRVFNVGYLCSENAALLPQATDEETREFLNLPPDASYALVTWHPVTLDSANPVEQARTVLNALKSVDGLYYVFTGANADVGGLAINEFLQEETRRDGKLRFFMSLGVKKYVQAARRAAFVAGNSSSGVCEVPFLGTPVLDIGDRQKGRERPAGVIHCACNEAEIRKALQKILANPRKPVIEEEINHAGSVSEKIKSLIVENFNRITLQKKFYDL